MKLLAYIFTATLSLSVASANDVMKESMTKMDMGMNMIQKGFMHNQESLIIDGAKIVEQGNQMFSDAKTVAAYLPKDKAHLMQVALNQVTRISLDAQTIDLQLKSKAYVNAVNTYSDMLNACSRCHALVRSW